MPAGASSGGRHSDKNQTMPDLQPPHKLSDVMPETAKPLSGIQETTEIHGFRISAARFPE
ncbi:MAG: hypothetical protein KAJ73_04805, partial [Zetaproteobacteria bacterium]|nr:hypothetical protein [Zetaproteobacteria bacterium]